MLPFMKKGIAGSKTGKPPGTIMSFGAINEADVEYEHIRYDAQSFERKKEKKVCNLPELSDGETIDWICVFGHSNLELIKALADKYGISQLVVEDILNPDHRPKIEVFEDKIILIVKMVSIDEQNMLQSEQVSIVFGRNYVLTFQERPGDLFDPVRARLENSVGRIRNMKADYLAFALTDVIVDNYFVVLESFAEALEEQEVILINEPENFRTIDIHDLKMQLFYLRKIAWPLRELAHGLLKTESEIVREASKMFFADLYDHSVRILETTETLREVAIGVSELYMSNISLKMNEIMQTLTIISTIFIPMTFIAGLYGMNFEYMPELKWHYGYFGALGLMIASALAMLTFFRRKRWL